MHRRIDGPSAGTALPTGSVLLLLLGAVTGCATLRYQNTATFFERGIRASDDGVETVMFKASVLVPARDILTLEPLWREMFDNEAWNADGREVSDSSFYTNRAAEELTPERVARAAEALSPPEPPFRIEKITRGGGGNLGFMGTDAAGRRFLFKLDHPDYPELGSSAAIIGARILRALGYNVPPIYLVTIAGSGDARFDGRRATAALFLDGVRGHFHFDWFRHRRELRGLRLACAWINDTDRIGTNTLVVERDGRVSCYLIDFNSCLGSWQGRPKEPWRGHRYAWALLPPPPRPPPPIRSTALGRLAGSFDPLCWCPQAPNNAFNHMTAADAAWMICRIERLQRPQIEAIVAAAQLSEPRDARALVDILMRRRAAVLALAAEPLERQQPALPRPADAAAGAVDQP